jgi:uncharacterized protein
MHNRIDPSLAGMGSTRSNEQLIQDAEDRLAHGDGTLWHALLAEDVRWTVMGRTTWSGTYQGKAAVERELLAPLRAQYAERYRRTPLQLLADGDWVVARCQGQVTLKSGERYDNEYCFLYRLGDGLIHEIIEYGDTALIERVLQPRGPTSDDPRAGMDESIQPSRRT